MPASPAPDSRTLEALQQASTLDLYQLGGMIDRMLEDPRRILAVRALLHTGQSVQFADVRDGRLRSGKIAELRGRDLVIIEDSPRVKWTLPYVAVVPPSDAQADPPPAAEADEPAVRRPTRDDFSRGDRVAFEDRHLQTQVGVIVRVNTKTASVDTEDGQSWRVSFGYLRRVVDV